MDTKKRTTKHKTITESHNESNNQQRINNRTTALEPTAAKATGGSLNAFYWYQIFALDSVFESNFDNFTPAIIFQTWILWNNGALIFFYLGIAKR